MHMTYLQVLKGIGSIELIHYRFNKFENIFKYYANIAWMKLHRWRKLNLKHKPY